jgi:hypothetical protein
VHRTGVYFVGVGPKGPALERFPDIKKNCITPSSVFWHFYNQQFWSETGPAALDFSV